MRSRFSFLQWNAVPDNKKTALINSIVRILLAPIAIAVELVHLNERIIDDEPELGLITGK